ncbi:hypothetical protein M758_12G075200 [Ceratodon purpureus]|nr:hypothetical protein M758_12G075200 [Ceratodon purpureus]
MVWKSIRDANFELSFVNQIEHANYHEMQTRLATCRQKVGKKWQDEFESLTSTKGLDTAQTDQPFSFLILWKDLNIKIQDTVTNVNQEVHEILDDERYQNWKVAETDGWHSFLESNKSHWQEQLQNWTNVVLGFESSMRKYTSMMEVEMSSVRKKSYNLDSDVEIMKKDFESIFQRVLEDAADKHPAMATKVEGMIHKKYVNDSMVGGKYKFEAGTEDKIRFIYMLKTWTAEYIKSSTSFFLSQRETYNPDEVLRHKLMTRLQASLEDVQEYSDHLVDNMMQFTEKSIQEERKCSKALGQEMHNLVKISLTERMTKIQEDWDKQHNVSKKLEEQREYFWTCFTNHAKKLNGTKMLAMAFCNALGKDHLVSGFTALLSRNVVNELQSEQWVTNWKVMRAYLDLHLIELIESKETHAMIHYVLNGKGHYKCIVNKLIESAITNRLKKADLWTLLTGAITDAMNTAALAAGRSRSDLEKPQVYQESIISSLASLSPELAKSVSIKVSKDVCQLSGSAVDFYNIRDQVSKMINVIHLDTTFVTTADTVDEVRKRMVNSNTEGARPRCDEKCPRCGLPCFRASNHPGKHHTLHQPEGLAGVIDVENLELHWPSCSKSVELDRYMRVKGSPDFVPYKDFEKYFLSWTLPSC